MTTDQVNLLTQKVNHAFIRAYDATADQPELMDKVITEVPSGGRVEVYPWLYPPPMLHLWQGYRNYARLGETNYRVPNATYTAEFEASLEDNEDIQIAEGFAMQASAMARGAKEWPVIEALNVLSAGQTTLCFDDSTFFAGAARLPTANSHNIGSGDNIVTGVAAGTDAVKHAMVALVTKNKLVRPLLWQMRQAADFRTDAGSLESQKNRKIRWWSDLRGAAAFGFWWDAILVKWANTPTLAEVQATLGLVNARFRGFKYPKNLPSDRDQYPHGQIQFNTDNLVLICSTLIEHLVRQAVTLSLIAQTENYFRNFATLYASGYLDGIV